MSHWIYTTGLLVAALLTACESVPNLPPAEPLSIFYEQGGDDPALTGPGVKLIKSTQQLHTLGARTLDDFHVDFSETDLVLFALGTQATDGYWADITAIQKVGDVLYIQCTVNAPAVDQIVTQIATHPYCVATISKTDATTILSDPNEVQGQHHPD